MLIPGWVARTLENEAFAFLAGLNCLLRQVITGRPNLRTKRLRSREAKPLFDLSLSTARGRCFV